jgi:lactoylglutathione lyase/methylmalonyl-CoA/ethylmalonyl-CoA epimerase
VGIVLKDLDKAIKFFEDTFGAKVLWRRTFEEQKMESTMIRMGEAQFELSRSLDPRGVIGKFIEDSGEGIHHISLEVEDIDRALKEFKKGGLAVIGRVILGGTKIAFLYSKDVFGVLFEIIQPE